MYIPAISVDSNIHLFQKTQIVLLNIKKVIILSKYADYTNIFSLDSTAKSFKHTSINNYFIDLIDNKQPLYDPIYSLGLIELEILKIYIKTNLANSFIRLSKSPTSTPILFICKKDGSFWLYINYKSLNNRIIKNWYLFSLIGEFLNCLSRAKHFI